MDELQRPEADRTLPLIRAPRAGRRGQRGLSLFGMLLFGIVLVMLVVVGMRVFPTVTEYIAVKRAIERIASGEGGGTPVEIQRAFDRTAAIDDITSITGRDLEIAREGNSTVIAFRYEKRVPLFGPATLLLDYHGRAVRK